MNRLMKGLLGLIGVQVVVLLAGVTAVRADATCYVECQNGRQLTCSAQGSGCSCSTNDANNGGCEAACAEPAPDTYPEDKKCTPIEME